MAEPPLLDPFYYSNSDPFLLPCDPLPPASDLLLGDDIDLDLDLDIDFEFGVDDFLRSTDDCLSPPLDALADHSPADGSGVSSSSCASPHRQGSDLSHNSKSFQPGSPDSANDSAASGVVDKIAAAEKEKSLKRKKDLVEGSLNSSISKLHRSDVTQEDDKRKARLMRNRESAQLSRQRKKHYVEELEEKVKSMHATINELNARISYVMAENASLRQQVSGAAASPAVYPPLGPVPPMHFPLIPGYAFKPQGSHVPLVPIPRLKSQQPAPAPRAKKSGSKTKKVASVSLLGLLFAILIFGVVPGVDRRYRGNSIDITEGRIFGGSGGRILSVTDRSDGLITSGNTSLEKDGNDRNTDKMCQNGKVGNSCPGSDVFSRNTSETLPALLYVPRNGKHVKIDGNLIIHSVLAGEKAIAQAKENLSSIESKETTLSVSGSMTSALAVPKSGSEVDRAHSDNTYGNSFRPTSVEGPMQQWFREGMTGPILNSGMCTEVFQFDISSSSNGIIPATTVINSTSVVNTAENLTATSAQAKIKNRRILYQGTFPLNGTSMNSTKQFVKPSEGGKSSRTRPSSSIVVSVLADPKEAGNVDADGMISPKSISRIFVVVLVDSVKYITYSCVLPFKSSTSVL